MKKYRFMADDFSVRLPWFYFDRDFSRQKPSRAWNFEVNGLIDLAPADYDLRFYTREVNREILLGWDGGDYRAYSAAGGYFEVKNLPIHNFMISCYWRDNGNEPNPPVREVVVVPSGAAFPAKPDSIPVFIKYRRDTLIGERLILSNWDEFHPALMSPKITIKDLKAMVCEIGEWAARRQVKDQGDTHFGAIFSEEDKYDFQDAMAAAVLFARMFRWTASEEWRERAHQAKQYALRGQHHNRENPERFGGFPKMQSFETPHYNRLVYPLPVVEGVATCIIGNLFIRFFEEGMEPEPGDFDSLRNIAVWILNNESHPGVFRHHEGDNRGAKGFGDCQNSNALGAGVLSRIFRFLQKRGGFTPPPAYGDCQPSNAMGAGVLSRIGHFLLEQGVEPAGWLDASSRGVGRFIAGQEAIGEWPYFFAVIGRGQQYAPHSLPDHGMGFYHFTLAMEKEPWKSAPEARRVVRQAVHWYLCMCEQDLHNGLIDLSFDRNDKGLAFSSFTWCRFMAAASLFRAAILLGEEQPWQNLALKLMETVRARYWNRTNPESAPVKSSTIPGLKRVTWIQAAEWDAVLLMEIIDSLEKKSK
ncbi:MAG: hypothetical protein KJ964_12915 [Verrucomicrobia bacterium]|nr:hypothetical protein [Verrucomicrobiota bacterium]MBU1734411.1 hypothetical protein [Verrucomicrobiota bacterium]MBU1857317.1 hypothetical protein [Verrucomicrobiota bacterium]